MSLQLTVQPVTLILTQTVASSTPANTPNALTITKDPTITGVQDFVVPGTQVLVLTDFFIKATSDVNADGPAQFAKNSIRPILQTGNLTTLLISNNSRPRPISPQKPLTYMPNDHLSIFVLNSSAVGTANVTNTCYADGTFWDANAYNTAIQKSGATKGKLFSNL
jgi:hypothetical protein